MPKRSIAEIHAAHAKALEEHGRDEALEAALAAVGVPAPKYVHHFKPVPWASFDVTPTEAVALLESVSERMVYGLCARERGCLSVAPEEFLSSEYAAAKERWRVGTPGLALAVSAGPGFDACEVSAYVETSAGPVMLKLDVKGAYHLHPRSKVRYDSYGNVTSAEHNPPPVQGHAQTVKWGSGSPESCRFSFYFDQLSKLAAALVKPS